MPLNKKSSVIWNHFSMSDCGKKAKCNHCSNELAYTLPMMSNLGRHIKKKHPQVQLETNKSSVDEEPMEVYMVEEVGTEGGSHLKAYELTVKGFEEMDQYMDEPQHRSSDPDWTPEITEGLKPTKIASTNESSNNKKEKKIRRRSAVWNHFQKSPCKTSGQCLHCGKTIKLGTISNLSRHLRQKHPTLPVILHKYENLLEVKHFNDKQNEQEILRNEVDICTEVIEVNVNDIDNPTNVIETRTDESRNMQLVCKYDEINATNFTQGCQTEFLDDSKDFDINDYIRPKKTAVVSEQVDRQLVKMIVKGCHPVSMVDQSAFKDFVSLLNPKYKLPSANKIAQELIPESYRECEKRAFKSLQTADGVCLYIDQWKSKTSNYMCVTCHFINTDCKFVTLFLCCHVLSITEDAADIKERLHQTANDWEISHKIVAVVTDNTKLITHAVRLCNWPHIPHFLRTLSLVVHESLQTVKSLVYKVKNITEELSEMPEAIGEIYSTQKILKLEEVKLISKVKADWSSSFTTIEMLTRFVTLKTAICHVQHNFSTVKLTENEWKVLKGVIDILSIFKEIKKEVMEEVRVDLSKICFYIRAIKSAMRTFQNTNLMPSDATYVATIAEAALKEQFKDLEEIDLVTNVLLLDPRLKKCVFEDESEFASACSILKKEVCEVILSEPLYQEPKPKSFWDSFDKEVRKLNAVKDPIGKGILELENYLQEQLLGRNEDPLVWWDQRNAIYPRLFKLAKKYLCVTSKAVVRKSISFKSASMLSHLQYSKSSPPTESEVMFLHHNM